MGHQIALVLVSEASVLSANLVQKERDCLSLLMVSLLRNGFQPSLGALIRCKKEARRIALLHVNPRAPILSPSLGRVAHSVALDY